jgi:hypothetical protein
MDLFIHLYAILGIAIRLPEIEAEGQKALFFNAIATLIRMEKIAGQGTFPEPQVQERILHMRNSFIHWRQKGFAVNAIEQREIIATSVRLAGENDLSGL